MLDEQGQLVTMEEVNEQILIFGLQNGNIGAIEVTSDEAILLWEIECSQDEDKAPVSHLKIAQLKDKQ